MGEDEKSLHNIEETEANTGTEAVAEEKAAADKLKADKEAVKAEKKAASDKAKADKEAAKAEKKAAADKAKADKKAAKAEKKAKRTVLQKIARGLLTFFIIIVVLALIVLGAAAWLCEFWVGADADAYTEPEPLQMNTVELGVGDSYRIKTICADNERVASIDVEDRDIISVRDSTATALGEYFDTSVTVTTIEKTVPDTTQRYENIVVLGKDIAPLLCSTRAWLRDYTGVEPITAPRTELRELAIYEYHFTVKGLGEGTDTELEPIELRVGDTEPVPFELKEGEEISNTVSADIETADISGETDDEGITEFTVKGVAEGETVLTATVGFWKKVDSKVYAEYKIRLTLNDGEEDAEADIQLRENEIFVPTRTITCPVEVSKKATGGYWGGYGGTGGSTGGNTSGGGSGHYVSSNYGWNLTQADLDAVHAAVNSFMSSYGTAGMSASQKVRAAHDFLCATTNYQYDWNVNKSSSAWGPLVAHEGTCFGYSRAFLALCDGMGVPCCVVSCNASSSNPNHGFNIVCVDGTWYVIDVQCNDSSGFDAFYLVSGEYYRSLSGIQWDLGSYPAC